MGDIQKKIRVTQGKIGKRKGTERLLTTQISAYSQRIGRLQGRIGTLQSQQSTAQADLVRQFDKRPADAPVRQAGATLGEEEARTGGGAT